MKIELTIEELGGLYAMTNSILRSNEKVTDDGENLVEEARIALESLKDKIEETFYDMFELEYTGGVESYIVLALLSVQNENKTIIPFEVNLDEIQAAMAAITTSILLERSMIEENDGVSLGTNFLSQIGLKFAKLGMDTVISDAIGLPLE